MTKIIKFVYALVLFLSLFIVSQAAQNDWMKCKTDDECPKVSNPPLYFKCIDRGCRIVIKMRF
ncbi:Nodule Cysteine-Rich (NCR) secreted peptide [Medicago truncatula]|uniref:Nodule Cysteine-Rich (NCR) secreted peptide n=1 Tax=Medicago truncatula TaxID=3880 RepID=G7K8Y8_MEDTR|nr:Nodule Cysteine-Rich (NCR) secreted peptide [Medicago truncatula]